MTGDSPRAFVERYARLRPGAFVWWRLLEYRAYQTESLAAPVLDLGSGDGLFGSSLCQARAVTGADRDRRELRCTPGGTYLGVTQCAAESLPFATGCFQTVLSNCVLEHVADLDAALAEAARVLRHEGQLLATVPAARFGEQLLGARLLPGASGRLYGELINRALGHKNLLDDSQWHDRLRRAGFRSTRVRPLVSPIELWLFEGAMVPALPSFLSRRITGRWRFVAPKPGIASLLPAAARMTPAPRITSCAAYLVVATR